MKNIFKEDCKTFMIIKKVFILVITQIFYILVQNYIFKSVLANMMS